MNNRLGGYVSYLSYYNRRDGCFAYSIHQIMKSEYSRRKVGDYN